jgi:hypothetical protein
MGSGASTTGGDGGIESAGVGEEVVARSLAGLIDTRFVNCGRSGIRFCLGCQNVVQNLH